MPVRARWWTAGVLAGFVAAVLATAIYFPRSAAPPSAGGTGAGPPAAIPETGAAEPRPTHSISIARSVTSTVAEDEPAAGDQFSVSERGMRRESIRGIVYDPKGKPVAYAHVRSAGHPIRADTSLKGEYVLSDLEAGTYELVGSHEDFSDSPPLRVAAGSAGVNFTLRPIASIEGRVVSAVNGAPITEFRIGRQEQVNPPGSSEIDFKRFRHGEGDFLLSRVKGGTHSIAVGAKGYADAVVEIPVVLPGEARRGVVLRLYPGAVIEGRVVDFTGRPLRLAQVSGGSPRRGVVSGADGSFRMDSLTPGPMELTIKHEEYSPKVMTLMLSAGAVNRPQVVLDKGGILEGQVTLAGKGVPGHVQLVLLSDLSAPSDPAEAFRRHDAQTRLYGQAGEDGRYRIKGVPEGRLAIDATLEPSLVCYETWQKSVTIDIASEDIPVVDFNFPPATATIEGSIFGGRERLAQGRMTLIASYADFGAEGPVAALITKELTGWGTYLLCVPAGEIQLVLQIDSREGYEGPTLRSATLTLQEGEHARHDFRLHGARLRLKLSGASVPEMSVAIVVRGEQATEKVSRKFFESVSVVDRVGIDGSGEATVWALEAGVYTVYVQELPARGGSVDSEELKLLGRFVVNLGEDEVKDLLVPVSEK